jgi:histidyl-tRNA synthetase
MAYADKIGVPFAVLIGEDEMNAGVLSVKDMRSGEQVKLSPDEAARHIEARIAEMNAGAVIKE